MTLLDIFLGEFLGTLVLILLGNAVVSNVLYKKTKGSNSGLIVIAFGWGFAVMLGIIVANMWDTTGHLNPAITIAKWITNSITSTQAVIFFISQFLGALIGQVIVNIVYWKHIQENTPDLVLASHATGPTHKDAHFQNFFTEFIATAILITCALSLTADANAGLLAIAPIVMAFVVFSIGLSLGGTTGYAINPFRDLAPRIVFSIMNFKNKDVTAEWEYGWVPVLAPSFAGVAIGLLFLI